MSTMVNKFQDRLGDEMGRRGWSQSDLARAASVSRSAVSMVMNEGRQPGPDLCKGIADALGYPPEEVFRWAGLLPIRPDANETTERALHLLDGFKRPETRQRALEYLEFLRLQEEKGEYNARPSQVGSAESP